MGAEGDEGAERGDDGAGAEVGGHAGGEPRVEGIARVGGPGGGGEQ